MKMGQVCRITALAITCTLGQAAWACSQQSFPRLVPKSFVVAVSYEGRPIVGLTVALSHMVKDDENTAPPVVVAKTDASGKARFVDLAEGDYWLELKNAVFPYSLWVQAHGKTKQHLEKLIELEWPGGVIRTAELEGVVKAPRPTGNRLMDIARPDFQALAYADLVLHEAISGRVLQRTQTDNAGQFRISGVPAGLYGLQITRAGDTSHRAWDTYAVVQLDPNSTSDSPLELQLYETCGSEAVRKANAQAH